MDETARHYEIHAQSTSSSRPSLVDLLPSSFKEVTIVGPTTCRNAKKLLDQLAHAKAVHFPGLKNVHMVKTVFLYVTDDGDFREGRDNPGSGSRETGHGDSISERIQDWFRSSARAS